MRSPKMVELNPSVNQSQHCFIGSSSSMIHSFWVFFSLASKFPRKNKHPRSWQRVKAIKQLSQEIPSERWKNNLYFFISRSVFQLQFMLEISTHSFSTKAEQKTWELVVKHIRNCFYVSVFRCSSILLKSKIASLLLSNFFSRKIVPYNFST